MSEHLNQPAPPLADVPPRKVYLELTTECNLDCRMCIRHSWTTPGGSMSRQTFDRVIMGLGRLPTCRGVNFSGYGEPMCHPLFWDFLARVKQAGLWVELVTNATLLDAPAADRLVALQADRVIVSVDAVRPAAQTPLHPGSLADLAPRLRAIKDRKTRANSAKPDVCLEFVATRSNIHELPALRRLSVSLGFSSILVTNLAPHTEDLADQVLYRHWSTTARSASPSPYSPLVDLPQMDAVPEVSAAVDRLRHVGTRLRINAADVHAAGPRCPFVAQGRFAIRHDGLVSPCLPLLHDHTVYFRSRAKRVAAFHLGNVNESDLADIWGSPAYRELRRRVLAFEFSPCTDCGGCDLRESNRDDCSAGPPPRCGECLWAAGLLQCP
ncbi:MAG: pyrroloquinoline quinone biosynthesis protein PqqE [Planctomycetes bacterium ADurb.Bin126]|nr:MAG: pyrroloquinoline quinone biosynthesis protein PqqE [Planctomycetes bacterium ADurb.Bin126]HOD81893.1 SPASM domain-containing protein [Phycisphaerae bacterium]HQL74606.1 SPASM domain-containing protein [Phycisphaerae bacterium]